MEEKTKIILEKVKEAACVMGKAAGDAVDVAAKKAGEVVETTKLSINNFELKTEIEVLYKEIGKLVYLTHLGLDVDPEDIEVKLELIDDKNDKIEINDKKRKEIKG